jgi:hypothetical protein
MVHLHERLCQASPPTIWRGSLLRPVGIHIGQLNEKLDFRMAPWSGDQPVRIDFNEYNRRMISSDRENGIVESWHVCR